MSVINTNMDAKYAAEVRARMAQQATQRASIAASGATAPTGAPTLTGTPRPGVVLPTPPVAATLRPAPVASAPVASAPVASAPGAGTPAGKPAGIAQRAFNATKEGAMKYGGKTLNAGKGVLGLAGKFLTPLAFTQGAAQSYGDTQNGYKENFDASIGGGKDGYGDRLAGTLANFLPGDKELFSDLGTNTLRTMGSVGDALTGGYASKFGSGISSSLAGEDFSEGFDNTPRDRFNALRNTPAATTPAATTPAAPNKSVFRDGIYAPETSIPTSSTPSGAAPVVSGTYQSNTLAQMGVPVDQQNNAPVSEEVLAGTGIRDGKGGGGGLLTRNTSAPGVTNLGSYGGDSNIYATASKPGGRLDTFTGVGAKSQGVSSAPETAQDKALNALTNSITESGRPGNGAESTIGNGPRSRARSIESEYAPQLEKLKNLPNAYAKVLQLRDNAIAEDRQLVESGRVSNAQNAQADRQLDLTAANNNRGAMRDVLALTAAQQNASTKAAGDAAGAGEKQAAADAAQLRKNQETGRKRFDTAVDRSFNEDLEKAKAYREQFSDFVSNTDIPRFLSAYVDPDSTTFDSVKTLDDIFSLDAPDQDVAIAALKTAMEADPGKGGTFNRRQESKGYEFPSTTQGPRNSSWADVTDSKYPLSEWAGDTFNPLQWGNDKQVIPMEDGTVVSYDRYIGNSADRRAQYDAMRKTKPRQPTK